MSRVNFVKRNFTDGDDDAVLLEYLHNGHLAIITLNGNYLYISTFNGFTKSVGNVTHW